MQVTNEEILTAGDSLGALLGVKDAKGEAPSAKVAAQVGRFAADLQRDYRPTSEARLALFHKWFPDRIKNGNIDADPFAACYADFVKERDEFFSNESERHYQLVVLPQDYQVMPVVFMAMGKFVSLSEETPKKAEETAKK